MKRSEARELLMQIVFQMEAQHSNESSLAQRLLDDSNASEKDREYILSSFMAIAANIDEIDFKINSNSKRWNTNHMPKADLAILRTAIGETMAGEVPKAVAINEAVEMAKKYGEDNAPVFINGVLGGAIE